MLHFLQRGLLVPALYDDAVHGGEQSGAVVAVLAVHQYRAFALGGLQLAEDAEHLGVVDPVGVGRQAEHPHRSLAQPGAVVVLDEADHRLHLQALQQRDALCVGQRAAIEGGAHAVEVDRRVDRLRPGWRTRGGSLGGMQRAAEQEGAEHGGEEQAEPGER